MNAYELMKRKILEKDRETTEIISASIGIGDSLIPVLIWDELDDDEIFVIQQNQMREYRLEEARRMALDIDNQFMSAFYIPAPDPTPTDRCPFCREPIDLDKVNAVGPKGTSFEGKIIHRACEITLLQKQRNQQLAEERGEEIAISF